MIMPKYLLKVSSKETRTRFIGAAIVIFLTALNKHLDLPLRSVFVKCYRHAFKILLNVYDETYYKYRNIY